MEIGDLRVTFDMKRTLIVFFALVGVVFVCDQVSRRILGLDCIGPVLPAWGCVAEPYPTTFAAAGSLSGSLLFYGGMIAGGLLTAFVLRDIVFGAAGYLLGRYRPDLVKKLAEEEEPRSYRIR
jgi:hypothetical protein